jgi:hypothetical protein
MTYRLSARVTIGIPTQGKRPDLLSRAVGSALAQSTPARVLVADQSRDGSVARQLEPYADHPLVRVVESPATCLWQNWCHTAESCDTEIFAWLQDDDVVAPHFTRRLTEALDRNPEAVAWIARLGISTLPGQGNWWQATGPMVPMDLIHGGTTTIDGRLLTAAAFFSSFALSPAVAFRWSPETIAAVRRCPEQGCDLYNERLVLAELGRLGPIVCDPVIAGYWVLHEANESRLQMAADEGDDQYRAMAAHAAELLAGMPGWQDVLRGWLVMVGGENLIRFRDGTERHAGLSPAIDDARAVLASLLSAPTPAPAPQPATRQVEPEIAVSRKARRAEKAVRR